MRTATQLSDNSSKTLIRRIKDGSLQAEMVRGQWHINFQSLCRLFSLDPAPGIAINRQPAPGCANLEQFNREVQQRKSQQQL